MVTSCTNTWSNINTRSMHVFHRHVSLFKTERQIDNVRSIAKIRKQGVLGTYPTQVTLRDTQAQCHLSRVIRPISLSICHSV